MSTCNDVAQECVREELQEKNEELKKTVAMMGTDVTRWSTECEQLEARLERALSDLEDVERELNLVAGRERRLQAEFDQLMEQNGRACVRAEKAEDARDAAIARLEKAEERLRRAWDVVVMKSLDDGSIAFGELREVLCGTEKGGVMK
jgi:chromosome segregation ATPase